MGSVQILDCGGSIISFKNLGNGGNLLFKSSPILKCKLKVPLRYLCSQISEAAKIPEQFLSVKVDNYHDGKSCVLTVSNCRGVVQPAALFNHSTIFSSSHCDNNEYGSDSEEDDEDEYEPYTIRETILIYYDNEYIVTHGKTPVCGVWYYIIKLYKFFMTALSLFWNRLIFLYLITCVMVYLSYFWTDATTRDNFWRFVYQAREAILSRYNSFTANTSSPFSSPPPSLSIPVGKNN